MWRTILCLFGFHVPFEAYDDGKGNVADPFHDSLMCKYCYKEMN